MLMATAAPSLILGLVAGVYVDRYDRRRIMIAADVLRAILVCLIPVLVPHGIGWLYAIVALTSSVATSICLIPSEASDEVTKTEFLSLRAEFLPPQTKIKAAHSKIRTADIKALNRIVFLLINMIIS
jgi:MFS family permease